MKYLLAVISLALFAAALGNRDYPLGAGSLSRCRPSRQYAPGSPGGRRSATP